MAWPSRPSRPAARQPHSPPLPPPRGSRIMTGAPTRSVGHAGPLPHGMGSSSLAISGAIVKEEQQGCEAEAGVEVTSAVMQGEHSFPIHGGR